MHAGPEAPVSPRAYAALAGFEAGAIGVIAMLFCLGLASVWYRHTVWTVANIMASNFYGDEAIGPGFAASTLSGLAVYFILYSLFGALFGAVIRGSGFSRLRLVAGGLLAGAAWYYLWFGLLWRHFNPIVPLYTHDRPMLWGHLLYGAMLGRFPLYYRRLTAVPPAPTPLPAPLEQPVAEPVAEDTLHPPE